MSFHHIPVLLAECIDGLAIRPDGGEVLLCVKLPAGSGLNINPTLVLDAFTRQTEIPIDWLAVKKTAVLTKEEKNFA